LRSDQRLLEYIVTYILVAGWKKASNAALGDGTAWDSTLF